MEKFDLDEWNDLFWPRDIKDQEAMTARAMLRKGYHKGREQMAKEIIEKAKQEHEKGEYEVDVFCFERVIELLEQEK